LEIGTHARQTSVIATNRGLELKISKWPHDCEFQLVAFDSQGNCEVVWADGLAADIGEALRALDDAAVLKGQKPDWYRSLELYASPGPEGTA
jgi:hypothetical protein